MNVATISFALAFVISNAAFAEQNNTNAVRQPSKVFVLQAPSEDTTVGIMFRESQSGWRQGNRLGLEVGQRNYYDGSDDDSRRIEIDNYSVGISDTTKLAKLTENAAIETTLVLGYLHHGSSLESGSTGFGFAKVREAITVQIQDSTTDLNLGMEFRINAVRANYRIGDAYIPQLDVNPFIGVAVAL